MKATPLRVVLVAAWAIYVAQAATVVLVDSASNSVVRHTDNVHLDTKTLVVADAALLRLQPPFKLSSSSSAQVDELFSSASGKKMLTHPTAFLFVNLFGLQQDGTKYVLSSLSGAKLSAFDLAGSAASWLKAVRDLASGNPDVPLHHLDRFNAQDCDESCVSGVLQELLPIVDGEYKESSLHGVLKLPSAELDLSKPAARLFAIELSLLFRSAKKTLSSSSAAKDVLVMDVAFSNLAEIADAHGSEAAEAAVTAIMKVVGWVKAQYEAKNQGHFAYQVAVLDKLSDAQLESLLQPVAAAPARFLSEQLFNEKAAAAKFSSHATVYGAAFVLVYFTFAGIYCLTFMPFKQDTLLYSKGKVD